MKWILTNQEDLLSTVPFTVQRLSLVDKVRGPLHDFHRLRAPDWANILPITREGSAILIRQPRAGAMRMILESPGGAVDADETDPLVAAARELEEETGYTSERMTHIASINPNPALFSNRIHFFLAEGCFINPARAHFPDSSEDIEIVLVPVDELEEKVAKGEIDHALAALGIMLSLRRLKSGN